MTSAVSILSLLPLLAVHWGALISPGPNTLLVTQTAISRSRIQALAVAAGIASGGFLWCLSTLAGLAILLSEFTWLRLLMHLCGGGYLCYLSYRLWKNSGKKIAVTPAGTVPNRNLWRSYLLGLSTNITNPKTAVYFASILPIFLPAHAPLWFLALIVFLIAGSSLLWHVILALGLSHRRIQQSYLAAKKWIDRVSGSILGLFGLKLILSFR